VTRVAPPQVEVTKGVAPATIIGEIKGEERFEIIPVKSLPKVQQTKDAPKMLNYTVPREPLEESRESVVRERRSVVPKGVRVEREERERAAAPPEEEELVPPEQEMVVREHRIEVPVDFLRIVEKTVQVPVEKVEIE
jgi:hypothetical protein